MMTTSNEHNNASAVPQGEQATIAGLDAANGHLSTLLDDSVLMLKQLRQMVDALHERWSNGGKPERGEFDLLDRVDDWLSCRPDSMVTAPAPAQGEPFGYFRAEPVRLPSARTDRVYLAGPMTGIAELNFPAFNQEAERLRAEGLQVLNPADHGIVDGADWADYLRHDIAGLSSCERIHLLRGWTKSKGACLEMTIAKALGMTVTYQVDAEIEHNNAPAVPQGWTFSVSDDDDGTWLRVKSHGGREAAFSAVNGGLAHDNRRSIASRVLLELKEALAATPAPAPAQEPDDKAMLEVIDERDRCHEWADQLADAIAKHTGYEIGEHTSGNNPWRMAWNALVCHEAKQEAGLTDAAGLSMLIAGALFDFGGYLTTHPDVIDVGSTALAGPVADRIKAFAAMRGLSLDDAAVLSWSEGIAALRAKGGK